MRHRKNTIKLGMKSQHRRATLANLVCSLIEHSRIRTTVTKAKAARRWADRMVTLAKKGSLHHRRQAAAFLRQKRAVKKLFDEIRKLQTDRNGGYTRVIRIGSRVGDAAEMAILEWTGTVAAAAATEAEQKGKEPKGEKSSKNKEAAAAKGE